MRWWENYLVRYLLGNIIGAIIIVYYLEMPEHDLWREWGFQLDSSRTLIILGVLGFAYCYIASLPILVFHAGRHLIIKKEKKGKDDKKINWLLFSPLWIAIVTLIVSLMIASSEIKNYLLKLNFTWIDFCCYGCCVCFILTIIYVWVIACKIIIYRETGYLFLKDLSKRRSGNIFKYSDGFPEDFSKDFRASYSHLREHSNACFIVLFELILLPIFLFSAYRFLPLIIALWTMPAALIWWYATWIEIKFSDDDDLKILK